jgi:molybdopterin-guanine dinucleotide biosynthesis protein A
MANFSLVLNAGGESRRMGQTKALLPTPPLGEPLLRHMLLRVAPLPFDQVILVANDPRLAALATLDRPVRVVADAYSGGGALGGLATGLRVCTEWGICLACDMPLVNAQVLEYQCSLIQSASAADLEWDAVVPWIDGQAHPFHALYHRRVIPAIEARLQRGQRQVAGFLAQVRTRWVSADEMRSLDPEFLSITNANTPEEWQAACRHLLVYRTEMEMKHILQSR